MWRRRRRGRAGGELVGREARQHRVILLLYRFPPQVLGQKLSGQGEQLHRQAQFAALRFAPDAEVAQGGARFRFHPLGQPEGGMIGDQQGLILERGGRRFQQQLFLGRGVEVGAQGALQRQLFGRQEFASVPVPQQFIGAGGFVLHCGAVFPAQQGAQYRGAVEPGISSCCQGGQKLAYQLAGSVDGDAVVGNQQAVAVGGEPFKDEAALLAAAVALAVAAQLISC